MKNPSAAQVIRELRREVAVRQRVFPNWVVRGKISGETAKLRIACLEKAIELIEKQESEQIKMEL